MKQTMSMSLLLVLTTYTCLSSSLSVKSLEEHSAILTKFQSSVEEFSTMLTSTLKGDADMKAHLTEIISKDMAIQTDKLVMMTNGNLSSPNGGLEMCCKCGRCTSTCKACGKTCCCQGDQGCSCTSCASGKILELRELTGVQDTSIKMWAELTKLALKRDVTKLLAKYSKLNEQCCSCDHCDSTQTRCGLADCCVNGTECLCRSCSSNTQLYASSIRDPVSLTPEVEKLVAQVDLLVDSLLLHFM